MSSSLSQPQVRKPSGSLVYANRILLLEVMDYLSEVDPQVPEVLVKEASQFLGRPATEAEARVYEYGKLRGS